MAYYRLYEKLPVQEEPIAIDTQVLYWVFYADDQYIGEKVYQIPKYSSFLENIIENGNEIVVFGATLLELFKIIEINEYKIYLELNGIDKDTFSIKDYRKIDSERKYVQKKIDVAYKQINQVATIYYELLDESCCEQFIEDFANHRADFVDFCLVRLCDKMKIHNILTDDGDFKTIVNGINVFSGNKIYFKE